MSKTIIEEAPKTPKEIKKLPAWLRDHPELRSLTLDNYNLYSTLLDPDRSEAVAISTLLKSSQTLLSLSIGRAEGEEFYKALQENRMLTELVVSSNFTALSYDLLRESIQSGLLYENLRITLEYVPDYIFLVVRIDQLLSDYAPHLVVKNGHSWIIEPRKTETRTRTNLITKAFHREVHPKTYSNRPDSSAPKALGLTLKKITPNNRHLSMLNACLRFHNLILRKDAKEEVKQNMERSIKKYIKLFQEEVKPHNKASALVMLAILQTVGVTFLKEDASKASEKFISAHERSSEDASIAMIEAYEITLKNPTRNTDGSINNPKKQLKALVSLHNLNVSNLCEQVFWSNKEDFLGDPLPSRGSSFQLESRVKS
jgi:hypothetical protein